MENYSVELEHKQVYLVETLDDSETPVSIEIEIGLIKGVSVVRSLTSHHESVTFVVFHNGRGREEKEFVTIKSSEGSRTEIPSSGRMKFKSHNDVHVYGLEKWSGSEIEYSFK